MKVAINVSSYIGNVYFFRDKVGIQTLGQSHFFLINKEGFFHCYSLRNPQEK